MEIIDVERKGNLVRFYLGKNLEQWGDDWDDAPYDCNAGTVYQEYVKSVKDVAFPFESFVLEPCDGTVNCCFCKKDMSLRKVPCLIVVPPELAEKYPWKDYDFNFWNLDKTVCGLVQRFYFGDEMEVDNNEHQNQETV